MKTQELLRAIFGYNEHNKQEVEAILDKYIAAGGHVYDKVTDSKDVFYGKIPFIYAAELGHTQLLEALLLKEKVGRDKNTQRNIDCFFDVISQSPEYSMILDPIKHAIEHADSKMLEVLFNLVPYEAESAISGIALEFLGRKVQSDKMTEEKGKAAQDQDLKQKKYQEIFAFLQGTYDEGLGYLKSNPQQQPVSASSSKPSAVAAAVQQQRYTPEPPRTPTTVIHMPPPVLNQATQSRAQYAPPKLEILFFQIIKYIFDYSNRAQNHVPDFERMLTDYRTQGGNINKIVGYKIDEAQLSLAPVYKPEALSPDWNRFSGLEIAKGRTILTYTVFCASTSGRTDLLKTLLSQMGRVDIEFEDAEGNTALGLGTASENNEVVMILFEKLDTPDPTPAPSACSKSKFGV